MNRKNILLNRKNIYCKYLPVLVAGGRGLQEVLEQEDELREPLYRLHHQAEEIQPVVGADLLHLKWLIV